MLARNKSLKIAIILFILILPFMLTSVSFSQTNSYFKMNNKEKSISSNNYIITAGRFQYLNITIPYEIEKICVIAFHGNSILRFEDFSITNYYKWEYSKHNWSDLSNYDSIYIDPNKCLKNNNTYSFYIRIDDKAKPGQWTIKILIDDEKQIVSIPSIVIVASFNSFISAIMGIYESKIKNKKILVDSEVIPHRQRKIKLESENRIEEKVDKVIQRNNLSSQDERLYYLPQILYTLVKNPIQILR